MTENDSRRSTNKFLRGIPSHASVGTETAVLRGPRQTTMCACGLGGTSHRLAETSDPLHDDSSYLAGTSQDFEKLIVP